MVKAFRDLGDFKNVLPYASEIFGVYQPLLGWKSKRTLSRMAKVVDAQNEGDPAYHAMAADPDASIEVKDETIPVRASTAEGEERSRLWSLMAEVWPAYDDYQTKTDREIPVVALTRRSA